MNGGVSSDAIKAAEYGSSAPGSFFTIRVDPSDRAAAIETAAVWGSRHGGETCVVICRLPRSAVESLEVSGDLVHGTIPVQSVFRSRSFPTLNEYRHLWKVEP